MKKAVGCTWGALLLSLMGSSLAQVSTSTRIAPPLPYHDSIRTDLADYAYPVDAGHILTSVFGEYRRTHFHGGIDISTGDDIGYKVFASRDGHVARVTVSPTGYGKSVWVRHADGFTTTYNHLSKFSEAIELLVRSEQNRLQRYPVFIEPNPAAFPVRKGDVIAYTGETGTGSPHLHFEIRDEKNEFINPLLCKALSFLDDSIPRIRRIALTPLGENSFVNGSSESCVIEIPNPVRTSIALAETVHASGAFGFAVDARDRTNESRFNSGVYSHMLFLDDSLAYAVRFDRAPSKDDYQVRLHYDYDLMSEEEGRYERLYANSPNRLPFSFPKTPTAGVIDALQFGNGTHRFRIISEDFKKNSVEVSGTIIFSPPPEIRFEVDGSVLKLDTTGNNAVTQFHFSIQSLTRKRKNAGWHAVRLPAAGTRFLLSDITERYDVMKIEGRNRRGTPALPRFFFPRRSHLPAAAAGLSHETKAEFVRVFLTTTGAFTGSPTLLLFENNVTRPLRPIPVDYNRFTATFRPSGTFSGIRSVMAECEVNGRIQTLKHTITVYPVDPNRAARISVDNANLVLVADTAAFFKQTFLEVEKRGTSFSHYSLLPRFTVANRGIVVKMRVSSAQFNPGMYYRNNGRGNWSLASTRREGEYLVDTLERWLGDISVQSDSRPPSVTRLSTPRSFKRQPHYVSFRVGDNLSGIEYKELKLYIDGTFVVPQIDGEHRRVVNRLPAPLTRGTHSIRILLKDRLGNTNEIRRTFRVR